MRKLIGHVSVDSGMVWVGDPCYVFHKEKLPASLGQSWGDFCEILGRDNVKSFGGLGIAISTLVGDGKYPVYGYFQEGSQKPYKIEVVF